jgi:hypothetical protein
MERRFRTVATRAEVKEGQGWGLDNNPIDASSCDKCQRERRQDMGHLDRYDVIGVIIVVALAALWIAHLVLPAPPPVVP